jgi:hypothetical protein
MKKTHWNTNHDAAIGAWLPSLTRAELCMVADGSYSQPGGRHTMDVRRLYAATGAATPCERKIARRRASMFAQVEVSR